MPVLAIRLLGTPEIRRAESGERRTLSHKALGLLAYLLAGPHRTYTREQLAGLFWGESDEEHANYYLRRALWDARKAINPPGAGADTYLCFADGRYSFQAESDCWLDLREFERILGPLAGPPPAGLASSRSLPHAHPDIEEVAPAIELYRGRFLEGVSLRDCPSFMDWLDLKRNQLENLFIEGLRALAVQRAERSDHLAAISALERILALDPLDEDAVSSAMVAYYQAGRRDKALKRYQSFHHALRQQLDLEPLPETRKLYLDLRNGTFVSSQSYALPPSQKPAALATGAVPLIGRETEDTRLHEALELAVQGSGCLAVVSGEAGIGKTRLVEEFLRSLGGFPLTLLTARCYAQERGLPYQPIIDALRAYLPAADYQHIRCLSTLWLAEVAKLLPELQERLPALELAAPALYPDQERNRLFEGLAQFIAHLGQRKPVMLFLDDLHAADEPTFDLLHYLVRRLATARVLVLCAMRVEELAGRPALAQLLAELERDSRLIAVPLGRLSQRDTAELVRRTLGAHEKLDELAHRLHAETGGNPFFLVEMLKAYREERAPGGEAGELPAGVRNVIQHRLELLDEQSRQLLSLAAVIGRQFSSETLHRVQRGDEQDLLTVLEWLISRGWVSEVPGAATGTYDFSHGLVRDVVYQGLRADRRQWLHRRVGLALEGTRAAGDEMAGTLAHHFLMGGEYEKAVACSLKAAGRAARLYANNEAIIHYRRALSIVENGDVRLPQEELLEINCRLAEAYEFLGEYEPAIAVNEAALASLAPGSPYFRRINFQLAVAHDRRGQYDQALARLRDMEAGLNPETEPGDRLAAAQVARGMAMIDLHRERSRSGLVYCARALELLRDGAPAEADEITQAELVAVYEIMANCHYHLADYPAAAGYYRQALEGAQVIAALRTVPRLLAGLGEVARHLGDYPAAQGHVLRSLSLSQEIGDVAGIGSSHAALGNLGYNCGDLANCLAHFGFALDIFRRIGDRHGIADACLSLAFAEIDLEQIDEAEAHLHEALRIGQEIHAALVLIRARYHLAKIDRARGRYAEAETAVREAIAAARRAGTGLLEAMGHRLLGEILAQAGQLREGEDEVLLGLNLFESQGDHFEVAWSWRSRARLLAQRGEPGQAQEWLARAAARFAELGAQRECASTQEEIALLDQPRI